VEIDCRERAGRGSKGVDRNRVPDKIFWSWLISGITRDLYQHNSLPCDSLVSVLRHLGVSGVYPRARLHCTCSHGEWWFLCSFVTLGIVACILR